MDFHLSIKHIRLSHQPVYPTMFVKNIQMYGVQKVENVFASRKI